MNMRIKIIILSIISLFIGFSAGFFINNFSEFCNETEYPFINLNLRCKDKLVVSKGSYIELKNKLEHFIEERKKGNIITDISIYFRDLQNGPTLDINEHINFAPASLLKLPLLVAYFYLAEETPSLLDEKIYFDFPRDAYKQIIEPQEWIVPDTTYTVGELLTRMMKYSDNQAYLLLWEHLNEISSERSIFGDTMKELGIVDPSDPVNSTNGNITVKSYASIFVQLYHVSFLRSKKMSNKALAVMTDVDFSQGLEAGVPKDIIVAHKFGERQTIDNKKQFHDCGVIYYPQNPYLLCIMTRGDDFNKLIETVEVISKFVYEEFNSRKL